MQKMTGEVGKLILDGKQVGGIRNWTAFIQTIPPIHSWVIASGFWVFNKINTQKLTAKFYAEINGELQLIRTEEVTIDFPQEYRLDTLITQPIKINFEYEFDWGK